VKGNKLTGSATVFDIEVESIDSVLLEGTGELGRRRVVRSERVPQEVGEPGGNIVIRKSFIQGIASNREHNSLSILLTARKVLPNLMAAAQQRSVVVHVTITLIAEV
jgi:hypothetical protein